VEMLLVHEEVIRIGGVDVLDCIIAHTRSACIIGVGGGG
jgi:hypothetical protein